MLNFIKNEEIFCGDINIRNMLLDDINNVVLNDFDNIYCCSYKHDKIQRCISFDKDMYILLVKFIIFSNSIRFLHINLEKINYYSYDLKSLFYDNLKEIFKNKDMRLKFIKFINKIYDMENPSKYLENLLLEYVNSILLNTRLKEKLEISTDNFYIVYSKVKKNRKLIKDILYFYFKDNNISYLEYTLYNSS